MPLDERVEARDLGYNWFGYNYLGPGTDLEYKLNNNIQPINIYDAAALIHDIEYLKYDQNIADNNMIANLKNYPLPVNAAFKIKDVVGYNVAKDPNKYLQYRQKAELQFGQILKKYGLHFLDQRQMGDLEKLNNFLPKTQPNQMRSQRRPPKQEMPYKLETKERQSNLTTKERQTNLRPKEDI